MDAINSSQFISIVLIETIERFVFSREVCARPENQKKRKNDCMKTKNEATKRVLNLLEYREILRNEFRRKNQSSDRAYNFPFDANTSTLETGLDGFFSFSCFTSLFFLANVCRCYTTSVSKWFCHAISVHVSPPNFFANKPFCNRSIECVAGCPHRFSMWQRRFGAANANM